MRSLQPFLVVDLKSLQSELKHRFKVEEQIVEEEEEDGTEEEEAMVTTTAMLLDL